MVAAIITETVLNPTTNNAEKNNFIRQAFTNAGFTANNFDMYGNDNDRYFVIKHEWDASKARGAQYLRLRCLNYGGNATTIFLGMFDNWNATTRQGTGVTTDFDIRNVPQDIFFFGNYPWRAHAINHPEVKGIILQQEDRFRHLLFLQPSNKFDDFGYDDINYPWAFVTNDLRYAYGSNLNPFQLNNLRLNLEEWTQLQHPLADGSRQVVPSPRLAPNGLEYGFAGSFSSDIALVASNQLPIFSTVTDNSGNDYKIINPRSFSGLAIRV